ncbi:hypothetical protein Ahy_A01g004557 [Arachis hypogaea]|uniref:Uncharacterized protein n=1 Tax=Arachis hypogaea TaxID=3818 RepID=A0A445EWG4_ARAHY|nr:hypothetical protein Ahy_A01g004557 [Arachis hypogaea]
MRKKEQKKRKKKHERRRRSAFHELQSIRDETGLLMSDILGLLGADYKKFSICEESWKKITIKNKVYNECIKIKVYSVVELNLFCLTFINKLNLSLQQIFHFDKDNGRTIKKTIFKSIRKSWKNTRLRLYDDYYDPKSTIEQNIEKRPPKIVREHWRWFLRNRNKLETQEKCRNMYTLTLAVRKVWQGEGKKSQNYKREKSVEESYRP